VEKPTTEVTRTIIEWPQKGSARRWPMGGWYVVNYRFASGYEPIAGPFRTKEEAEAVEAVP
jgi:hypothetical protein